MPNAGRSFLQGLQPFIGSTSQLISQVLLNRGHEEDQFQRKRDFLQQERMIQDNLLSTALGGGIPKTITNGQVVDNPKNKQFMAQLFSRMEPSTREAYNLVNKPTPPKGTVDVVGKDGIKRAYLENPQYKGLPLPNSPVLFEYPDDSITETSEVIPANTYKQADGTFPYKNVPDSVKLEVRKKMRGGEVIGMNPQTPWEWRAKDSDGGFKLSDTTIKTANDYFKDLQDLKAKLDTVKKTGQPILEKNVWGFNIPLGAADLESKIAQTQTQYQSFMFNNRSIESSNYLSNFDKSVSQLTDPKGQPLTKDNPNYQPTLWNDVWTKWQNKKIDKATLTELFNSFRAEFGYDPITRFGSGR